jgi:hypothetical protein
LSAEDASARATAGLPLADHLRNGELMREGKVELRCDCTLKGRDALAFPGPKLPSKEEVTLTYESATRVPNRWFSRSLHADFLLDCQTVFLYRQLLRTQKRKGNLCGSLRVKHDICKVSQKTTENIERSHTSFRTEWEGRI